MKLIPFLLALLLAIPCRADELVFAVSTGSAMPMTSFQQERLTGGLLKEFGDALAGELHYVPRYLNLPRKRVEAALAGGKADILCDLRPEWLDGKDWRWSVAIFSNNMIVVSRRETPPLVHTTGLRDLRVGTIHGYRYAQLEQVLGEHFIRDEAPSDDLNLSKLLRQRFSYMLTNSLYYDYQRMSNPERSRLNPLVHQVWAFDTYCALPPRGKLDLTSINLAIQALKRRGTLQAILDRYRPAVAQDARER